MESDDALLVFDYWRDPAGLLHQAIASTRKQLYFFVSHFHQDHYNPEILEWPASSDKPHRLLVSYDTVRRRRVPKERLAAVMRPGHPYEDSLIEVHPFRSSDIGVSVGVTVKSSGATLFHAGDLNNWYFADSPDEHLKVSPQQMEALYLSILREIKQVYPRFDHVMFPVDPRLGSEMMRGPRQWQDSIPTAHFHPMHQWEEGFNV
ncbi:MAG: MBL fold metallo-hydrolase [Bacteroidales bacterium]|nr:MBL fold metallo-hydrolase [Bacteroidales bacterium]